MHSILGAFCCAALLLAGPVLGFDVQGRVADLYGQDAELQESLEVDAAGHTLARRDVRASTRTREHNPTDNSPTASPGKSQVGYQIAPGWKKAGDPLAGGPLGPANPNAAGSVTAGNANKVESAAPDSSQELEPPDHHRRGNFGLTPETALTIFLVLGAVFIIICVYFGSFMGALCVAWVVLGVAGMVYAEGWTILTSLYVMVQIITTIGYGDVIPAKSQGARVLCGIYVVGSLLLIGTIVTDLMDRFMKPSQDVVKAKIANVKNEKSGGGAEQQVPHMSENMYALQRSFLQFATFVLIGTVFYATYEKCCCGYGSGRIEGCVDGERCPDTGGVVKTWLDAFNMSMITLTTVGFGDQQAMSAVGRGLGCIWMLTGVATTGNFVSAFGGVILANKKEANRLNTVSVDLFNKIDKNSDGTLSRIEFRSYALIKFGMVEEEDLDMIDNLFETIDSDGSGQLTFEEIMQHCDK